MKTTLHSPSVFRKVSAVFVLTFFLFILFFSFAPMVHGQGEGMRGGCPLSPIGESLCPQNLVADTVHHVAAYHSFLAARGPGIGAVGMSLLLVLYTALMFLLYRALYEPPMFVWRHLGPDPAVLSNRKSIRWLSLFENSPSFA